ncbi:MAG TPA: hypothetical protein VGB24_13470 [Longimicrobium sp.]|jgi:hypothetical protein|uniref:hypothetical protein n=1 Tax=Longimicrobium sp. TaxID=2029185 RepID=UPI002EDA7104
MKWHAQVAHVVRKDVRQFRWMIAAYAAAVAAATTIAMRWSTFGAGHPLLWMFAIVVLGMVLLAVLVQADSPARSTPFWVTLPLHPSAVLTAKLVVGVLVVLGLALVGQAAALSAHAVAAGDLPRLLGHSALSFGSWLGTAAVIAALAPDLRTFLLALTLTTLASFVGAQVIWSLHDFSYPRPSSLLIPVAELCCMVLLLAHQYLTRRVRRGVAAGVLLWTAGLLLLVVALRSSSSAELAAAGVVPGPLRGATINIDEVQFHSGAEPTVIFRAKGLSPVHDYVLVSPVVELRMDDGSSAPVRLDDSFIGLGHAAVPMEGIRWVNGPDPATEIGRSVTLKVTLAQRRALEQGRARLSLRGRVEVREPRVKIDLPLVAGVAAARQGLRMRVTRAEVLAQGPSVEVQASSVAASRSAGSGSERRSGFGPADHVLVNRSRGEGIIMNQGRSHGSGGGLVLPGPSTQVSTTVFEPEITLAREIRVEAGWLDGARLVVLEWVPLGSYPIAIQQQSP